MSLCMRGLIGSTRGQPVVHTDFWDQARTGTDQSELPRTGKRITLTTDLSPDQATGKSSADVGGADMD